FLKIEDVTLLLFHGETLEKYSKIWELKPEEVMLNLLKKRHLDPTFEPKFYEQDPFLVDIVPDIFVAGHVHTFDAETYRGTVMVNASTWQSQTEFQKQSNITPMPGYVFYYELDTGNYKALSFLS
ncbi:MAG: DNA polymerase II small subunit, partial [Thermoplasmata archaeon]